VLGDGVAVGRFRPGDERLRTLQLFGAVHWMWTWFDPSGPRSVAEVAESFVDSVLAGVLVDAGEAQGLAAPDGEVARVVEEALSATLDGDAVRTAG
jgi:hypothetical protein